jgi:hypothetical protein
MLEHGFILEHRVLGAPAEHGEFLGPLEVVPGTNILAGLAPWGVRQFALSAARINLGCGVR